MGSSPGEEGGGDVGPVRLCASASPSGLCALSFHDGGFVLEVSYLEYSANTAIGVMLRGLVLMANTLRLVS